MEVLTLSIWKTSTLSHATFDDPDLTAFCRLDELGLIAVGQRLDTDRAVLECRVAEPDEWCRRCGAEGIPRGTVARRLVHTPFGHRPTVLLVRVRRYRCTGCGRVWRQNTDAAAARRAKISHGGIRWGLAALVMDHMSMSRVAVSLGVSWSAANDAVLGAGVRLLINDPHRFDGVTTIGVDEHVWRHTRHGDKYVTVIIDLSPVRAGTGPARLLDMVEGRSKAVFKEWLAGRPAKWRDGVDVVAMDGFTGFKTATSEELPDAAAVMDPFHVVRLAGDAVENCRRRTQLDAFGRRGRKGDPLYHARRTLLTGATLLTEKQRTRLHTLFADTAHEQVETAWGIYQDMIAAYREKNRHIGKQLMATLINTVGSGIHNEIVELRKLGRTLTRRAADILAFFDRPGTSNAPTEAINGRLEHLRGTALGFRNLNNYTIRSLLETGGFKPALHPQS